MTVRREPRRLPSVMRKLVVALVVVVLLLVAADFGLRWWAQSWLEARVQESLATGAPAEVELEGFPFLVQFATGRFAGVDARLSAVDARGLQVRSIRLDLADVTFPRGSLLTRGTGRIHVGDGTGVVEVTEEALSAYVQQRAVPVDIAVVGRRIRVSTELEAAGVSGTASATGTLELDGRDLVFAPTEVEVEGSISVPTSALSFDVPVPRVLPGIEYRRVVVGEGAVRLFVSIRDTDLRVPAAD